MLKPSLRLNSKGIPKVSKQDIEEIVFLLIKDFCPEALSNPCEFDVDGFAERYLKAEIDYKYLSNDGRYLGMFLYNDSNKIIIYNKERDSAEYLSSKARTIFIDASLLEDENDHRLRYTLGHECGHAVLHSGIFENKNDSKLSFRKNSEPFIQCRKVNIEEMQKDVDEWTDEDRVEWQANYFCSALLMPKNAVYSVASSFDDVSFDPIPALKTMVNVFNVSVAAALYRIKELGISKCLSYDYAVKRIKEEEFLSKVLSNN